MKSLFLTVASVAVVTAQECDAGFITSKISTLGPFISGLSNSDVSGWCQDDTSKAPIMRDISEILATCGAVLGDFSSLLKIVNDNLCLKDEINVDEYCLPTMMLMVDTPTLAGGLIADPPVVPSFETMDFIGNIKNNKEAFCRATTCPYKITRAAVQGLRDNGLSSSDFVPFVMRLAKEATMGCTKDEDTPCIDIMTSATALNTTQACTGGKPTTCTRKLMSMDNRVVNPCTDATAPSTQDVIGNFIMTLTGIPYATLDANRELVFEYLKKDLGFNLPGVMVDNLDFVVTETSAGISIQVNLKGVLLVDLDIRALVTAFRALGGTDQLTMPMIDTMVLLGANTLMPSATMTVVSEHYESIVTDGDITPTIQDESAAPIHTLAASAALVVLAAIMAV